ncbi:MAG: hypothetical protein KJ720_11620 [Proteobacteria bacterium]|nr:hypothetical protein [Pseudomonadota bacterium]MBU1450438.1 hypothetical protein [Pseudomonadota bacterium]MBU2470378.1 hypothetical protein [Pseudomonadota bacterium]MBU2517740.1 hypothetical protein [Pseudomonadota bacterium]
MDDKRLWFLLNEVAQVLGVDVRLESLDGGEDPSARSGICRLRGKPVIFIERRQDTSQRCRRLGVGLLALDLDGVYLRPVVREYLSELAGTEGQGDKWDD